MIDATLLECARTCLIIERPNTNEAHPRQRRQWHQAGGNDPQAVAPREVLSLGCPDSQHRVNELREPREDSFPHRKIPSVVSNPQ